MNRPGAARGKKVPTFFFSWAAKVGVVGKRTGMRTHRQNELLSRLACIRECMKWEVENNSSPFKDERDNSEMYEVVADIFEIESDSNADIYHAFEKLWSEVGVDYILHRYESYLYGGMNN